MKELILKREDLLESKKDTTLDEITINHFKFKFRSEYPKCDFVVFYSEKGVFKVLKDRYSLMLTKKTKYFL